MKKGVFLGILLIGILIINSKDIIGAEKIVSETISGTGLAVINTSYIDNNAILGNNYISELTGIYISPLTQIIINPTMGTVGSAVTISGSGFGEAEKIRVNFGFTVNITQVTTTVEGSFTTYFTINTQPYGSTTIMVSGLNSGKSAWSSFCILPAIEKVMPTMGTVGLIITVRGNGFGASELVVIGFGKTPTIRLVSTYGQGNFITTFTTNTQPFGTKTIFALGRRSGAFTQAFFFILPNIVSITPTLGTVGSIVTIRGNGFGYYEKVRFDFGTTRSIHIRATYRKGSFTTSFTIDTQPYGTTTIFVFGLESQRGVECVFKVLPNIILITPSSGIVGSKVTVRGNGFEASEIIRIAFGITSTITSGITNARGEFQVMFTVDEQPSGRITIIAHGLISSGRAMANFYILPPTILKITPRLQDIAIGSTFTTSVELHNAIQVSVADIHLKFDPNILQVIEIGTGTFPVNAQVVRDFNNTSGRIFYGFFLFSPNSANGSGVVCNIVFKAIAGGESNVVFESKDNYETGLLDRDGKLIPWKEEEALYRIIDKISVQPKGKIVKAGNTINYTAFAYYGINKIDVTELTTFTAISGGSFTTTNTFLAKYVGTYTIVGEYLGVIGTTTVIVIPGTPTALVYVSGNNQVNTCTFTLKESFMVKLVDSYKNPCSDVEVNWEIVSVPIGARGYFLSSTKTTTDIQGIAFSFLTLGTEPPGTYTIRAISPLLGKYSFYTFTAHSLRRFGNITGYSFIDIGKTRRLRDKSVTVEIVELNTTTTTQGSYFFFEKIPVGSYTLKLDATGASPANISGVHILATQFDDTTHIGTISLLAGDINNDGKVNIEDWPILADAWVISATKTTPGWQTKYIEADFDHDDKVNRYDIFIFSENFGKQQTIYKDVKKIKPITSPGKIQLSFELESLEGVDLENLRIGDIVNLKVYIRGAKDYIGGEIHLSFDPNVVQVVDERLIPGDYPTEDIQNSRYKFEFKNKADNDIGKIDYAVGITAPELRDGGLLVTIPLKIISDNAYSKIECDFKKEENRQTMFIKRSPEKKEPDKLEVLLQNEIIIKVPPIHNNLTNIRVYPNPVKKGQFVTFDQLTSDKLTTLKIYTICGELVYENEGKDKIIWNLENREGEEVSAGIYIYSLKDELGVINKGKIGVIK